MSYHSDPPEYSPQRPSSSPTPQRNPPPYRPSSSFSSTTHHSNSNSDSDSSTSSGQSQPFAFNDHLASPDAPPYPASLRSNSDESVRSADRDDHSRSASSGYNLPFPFHDDITLPFPPPDVTEPGVAMTDSVLSTVTTATDISEAATVPLTPGPSQATSSHAPSRDDSMQSLVLREEVPKLLSPLERPRSSDHNLDSLPNSPATRASTNEDLEPAGPANDDPPPPPFTLVFIERPEGIPDGVNIHELWIDPFIYRVILGRPHSAGEAFTPAERAIVRDWLRARLDQVGTLRETWEHRLPSISLDPDERRAPLTVLQDGHVALHVALHRVTAGSRDQAGVPENFIQFRQEQSGIGGIRPDIDDSLPSGPPAYLRLFPCFCAPSNSALRRASNCFPDTARVHLIDYSRCMMDRLFTHEGRPRALSPTLIASTAADRRGRGRVFRPREIDTTPASGLSAGDNFMLTPRVWLDRDRWQAPLDDESRGVGHYPFAIEDGESLFRTEQTQRKLFPVIDEDEWCAVPIAPPRLVDLVPQPVTARPLQRGFLSRSPPFDHSNIENLQHDSNPQHQAVAPTNTRDVVIPGRWSPDIPQVRSSGPSLVTTTRPREHPVRSPADETWLSTPIRFGETGLFSPESAESPPETESSRPLLTRAPLQLSGLLRPATQAPTASNQTPAPAQPPPPTKGSVAEDSTPGEGRADLASHGSTSQASDSGLDGENQLGMREGALTDAGSDGGNRRK